MAQARPTMADESKAEKPERPVSFASKHPLQYRWVLWFDNPKLKKPDESWEENLKKIHSFDTVEDFWCLFNNIVAPTKLTMNSNFHICHMSATRVSNACLDVAVI